MGACIAKKSVQPEAVLRRLDLAGVALADGADGVAPGDARFQEIDPAEKFELLRIQKAGIQAICGSTSGPNTP